MGTINHRHHTDLPDNPAADISSDEWNDSLVILGGDETGSVLVRDTTALDGWTSVPSAAGILTCAGAGTLPAFHPAAAAPPLAHHVTHEIGGTDAIAALDAAVITQGTINLARLPASLATKPIPIADGGTGVTTGLTALNAANLTSGTIPTARFPTDLALTSSLSIGTNPATTGAIRLANNTTIQLRNNANTANIQLVKVGTADAVEFGDGAYNTYFYGTTLNLVTTNYVLLGAGGVNYILTSTVLRPNATDNAQDLGAAAQKWRSIYAGTSLSIGTNPATSGAIRLANNQAISWRNAANNADVIGVTINAADNLTLVSGGNAIINVTGHLVPSNDALYVMGTAAKRFTNIFVSSSVVNKVKTGTPTDADVSGAADGMLVLDSTANKIWVRLGGAWKGVAVA